MTDAKTVKLAHLMGPTDTPLVNKTIGQAVNDAAVQFGDQDAIVSVHQDIRLSFRELATKTDQLACGFLALGLAPGDRVGIWAPNCVEWAAVQYATAKAGLILVNINPAYRTSELEYAINKVGCKALLTATRFKTSDYIAMLCELAPELPKAEPGKLKSEKLPSLSSIITIGDDTHRGCYRYDDVAMMGGADETAKLNAITAEIKPEDPINIQFTSGTTGSPKGATLSHHNILNNALFTGERMRLTERDRMCVPVPLYHCFGMVIGNLTNLLRGTATIYPSEAFDAHATLTAVERERCTGLHGVPTMFVGVLEALDRGDYDVSTLRTGVMAGAPCPVAVMHRVVSDMNMVDITIGYGMTETSPLSWQTGPDDPLERRVSTVGTVHPHAEVMVADEQGNPLPCGTQGEFRTRGYCVMIGYWNDPERTAEAITEDGWMCTGDLGVIDEAGYGNITGRVKDMVIRGGENLFPREIEEALFTHPAVQDVQVFGVPDDKYGEELCAWIILKPGQHTTEAEIKAYFKGKIAHFKIPRYVRFVDSFPMTVTGKARKVEMRRLMSEALDLEQQKTA
ncbi:MAG: AMP-binding protein [Pseudomonadota bacterium]